MAPLFLCCPTQISAWPPLLLCCPCKISLCPPPLLCCLTQISAWPYLLLCFLSHITVWPLSYCSAHVRSLIGLLSYCFAQVRSVLGPYLPVLSKSDQSLPPTTLTVLSRSDQCLAPSLTVLPKSDQSLTPQIPIRTYCSAQVRSLFGPYFCAVQLRSVLGPISFYAFKVRPVLGSAQVRSMFCPGQVITWPPLLLFCPREVSAWPPLLLFNPDHISAWPPVLLFSSGQIIAQGPYFLTETTCCSQVSPLLLCPLFHHHFKVLFHQVFQFNTTFPSSLTHYHHYRVQSMVSLTLLTHIPLIFFCTTSDQSISVRICSTTLHPSSCHLTALKQTLSIGTVKTLERVAVRMLPSFNRLMCPFYARLHIMLNIVHI